MWQLDTPKEIRYESIRDLSKNIRNNVLKVKRGQISHFNMKFKTKRDKLQSIVIHKRAIQIIGDQITLFPTFNLPPLMAKGPRHRRKWFGPDAKLLRDWDNSTDVRLLYDSIDYYLLFPIKTRVTANSQASGMIALDPGLRDFQTGYSEREAIKFMRRDPELIWALRKKIDHLASLRAKGGRINQECVFCPISKRRLTRRMAQLNQRIRNVVDDLHWKTINYLTDNYSQILLPHFETSEMKRNRISRRTNRDFDTYRHYRFKMRLMEKCRAKSVNLYLVTEDYTTQTCGICGTLKKIGPAKIYRCDHCGCFLDRDINGARNIMLKNIKPKHRFSLKFKSVSNPSPFQDDKNVFERVAGS
jgi:transposase